MQRRAAHWNALRVNRQRGGGNHHHHDSIIYPGTFCTSTPSTPLYHSACVACALGLRRRDTQSSTPRDNRNIASLLHTHRKEALTPHHRQSVTMPFSPLIRPLSPLQTQSAPSLPAPYDLTDAIFVSSSPAEGNDDSSSQSWVPLPRQIRSTNSCSNSPNSGSRNKSNGRPRVSASPAPLHTVPSTFHDFITRRSASAEVEQDESHATQQSRDDVPHGTTSQLSLTEQGFATDLNPSFRVVSAPQPEPVSQGSHRRSLPLHTSRTSKSPKLPLPTSFLLPGKNPSATTAAVAASHRAHPYGNVRPQQTLPPHCSSPQHHGKGCVVAPHATSHNPPLESSASPLKSRGTASLLHFSTAGVAAVAAQPSYGATLLLQRRASPARTSSNFERRCSSPPPTASLHVVVHDARDTAPSPLSAAVGPTRDDDSDDWVGLSGLTTTAAVPARDSFVNCYRGTAVSSRTGRQYNIAIEASLLENKSSTHAVPPQHMCANTARSRGRKVTSVAWAAEEERLQDDEEKFALTEPAPADGGESGRTSADRDAAFSIEVVRKSRAHDGALERRCDSAPVSTRAGSPASCRSSPQPLLEDTLAPASLPAAALSELSFSSSRYIYPVLDECQRLLQEIQTCNPLMRRHLTLPRPLPTTGYATERDEGIVGTRAANAFTTVETAAAVEDQKTASAAVTGAKDVQGVPSLHRLRPPSPTAVRRVAAHDARRLYHWDTESSAEDLSYMHGPFRQSAESFAASTARHVQRLREAGTRLYGPGAAQQATSASFSKPRQLSAGVPLSSSAAAACRHAVMAQLSNPWSASANSVDNEAESPSGRLRRLLRETDAAFPALWKITHVPSASSPTHSEREREHSVSGSGSGVCITPSPSTIQPSQGEKDGLYREYDETTTASAKDHRSDFTLSRLTGPFPSFADEPPLMFTAATMTPARPPPGTAE
jgi:hypothetical protein